jgi:hypothetical protein
MTSLVERLSQGRHPVSLIRYKSAGDVEEAVTRGLILVKFTETQGGTELGVALDENAKEIQAGGGEVRLSGTLTLDYQPVRCTVNVDLETLTGYGFLEPLERT